MTRIVRDELIAAYSVVSDVLFITGYLISLLVLDLY
jgi:hypothetical protein